MIRSARVLALASLLLLPLLPAVPAAQDAVIDFASPRWTIIGGRVVEVLGRKAFMGAATLKDAEFENGVIEFDVAATTDRARSYPGVVFRMQPDGRWERLYIRPHRSALYNDTVQYVAAFNGVDSWQFYNGSGATALATIPVNQWLHVKIEVAGEQARVFLGNQPTPALVIPHLKHGASKGGLGVMGTVDGTAYFSNFSYRADNSLVFDPPPPVDVVPGVVRDWQISKPFPSFQVDLQKPLEAQGLGDPGWKSLSAEPGGLVDISRLYPRSAQPDMIFARTVIRSDTDQLREFNVGYSDVVTVFLNGQPVFSGSSQYQGRDQSFLGVVGWFDSVFLPLRKGDNELTLAVAEVSGGWGFKVRDGTAVFVLEGLKKAWETPKALLAPESVAYDAGRDCLYVSNYEPANPSGGAGKQAIAKLTPDGTIENPRWVTGLSNPSGLVVVGDRLYAVERQSIAEIDIPQAKVVAHHAIPGAAMPNDIAAGPDGALYVSDSTRAAIYRWTAGTVEEWIRDPRLARPNGITVDGAELVVGTNGDGCLKAINLQTKAIRTITGLGAGIIDGVERVGAGIYLVSHNEGRVFRVTKDGWVAKFIDQTVVGQNIADFTYIGSKGLLVFPTFTDNRVAAYTLRMPTIMSYRTDEEHDLTDRKRDARFQIDKALDSVGIKPGMTVAEVGAGHGYVAFKLAARVGASGRVVAEDISAAPLETLKVRAARRGLGNIDTRVGGADDPGLPAGTFDLVLMHATLKFVTNPVALFDNLARSLKPGGRIVVIEAERPNAVDLDGTPYDSAPDRKQYLALFGKTQLKVDRVDDKTVPHDTIFVLAPKGGRRAPASKPGRARTGRARHVRGICFG